MISRRAILRGTFAAALGASATLAARPTLAAAPPIRLRRGVNAWPWFDLTREYPAPRTDYAWPPFQAQRPVPTARDLARLRSAGFDFVRIPVDPGPFLAADPEPRERLLDDLRAAVGAALAADLSVVVNLQANGATHYWTPERMTGGPDAPAFAAYLGLIEDVARRLSSFPQDRVALEPINEPGGACDSEDARAVRVAMLSRARAVAAGLTLIATGGCGSLIQGLDAFDPTPLESLRPLLFTFHFYEPYLFSHQGAPWMREPVYRSLNGVPWPASTGSLERTLAAVRARMSADIQTPSDVKDAAYAETEKVLKVYFDAAPDRRFIDKYLGAADAWGKRHGIPNDRILMGEFGALRTDDRYVASSAPDRARYVADVRRAAEAFGFPWAFWNLFDGMGLMDDRTRDFDPAMLAALGLSDPRG